MARILIVDDSRTSRKILRSILEDNNHIIVGEAKDGQEAVELYKKYEPDLVTMDVTMPIMDGLEALKNIRDDHPAAVVVMVTAAGMKNKMIEALKSGASDFISKPFEKEDLLNVINRLV